MYCRPEVALEHHRLAAEMEPDNPVNNFNYGIALGSLYGREEEAIEVLGRSAAAGWVLSLAGMSCFHARLGHQEEARRLAAQLGEIAGQRHVSPAAWAWVAAGPRDVSATLDAMETSTDQGEWMAFGFHIFPTFDFLRDEPRFLELRKRVDVDHIPYSGRYKMRNGADHDRTLKDSPSPSFAETRNCAQSTFFALEQHFGLEGGPMLKALAPFPGVALRGETCGAVAGAMLALGLVFGTDDGSEDLTTTYGPAVNSAFASKSSRAAFNAPNSSKRASVGPSISPRPSSSETTRRPTDPPIAQASSRRRSRSRRRSSSGTAELSDEAGPSLLIGGCAPDIC